MDNISTEERVVKRLIENGLHITFAESCTAGMAAARLVNVPMASSVLNVSFVTYANEAKVKYAAVNPESLEKYGAVSEIVAGEMAKGAAALNRADVGVGISGIAGPDGGTDEKPVGTVCFGFYVNGRLTTYMLNFGNIGRQNVRKKSVDFVFDKLDELLR